MAAGLKTVQNFRGFHGFALTNSGAAGDVLAKTLPKLGFAQFHLLADKCSGGEEAMLPPATDKMVVFIDGDMDTRLDLPRHPLDGLPLVPVIGLVGVAAPSRLKSLTALGATAFLGKPVSPAAIYSALFLAVNQFGHRRHMTELLERHEIRRRDRMFVVKAVVARMRERSLGEDDAYACLRKDAMRARLTVEDLCRSLTLGRETHREAPGGAADVGFPGPSSIQNNNQRKETL